MVANCAKNWGLFRRDSLEAAIFVQECHIAFLTGAFTKKALLGKQNYDNFILGIRSFANRGFKLRSFLSWLKPTKGRIWLWSLF
jgi:hypothetical protein